MTNAQIILKESLNLMENGILSPTGRLIEIELEDGGFKTLKEPEPIHTYAGWKALGFQVKKGEKSIANFPIWKHTPAGKKKNKKTGEEYDSEEKLFLTKAFWFKGSQVTEIETREGGSHEDFGI